MKIINLIFIGIFLIFFLNHCNNHQIENDFKFQKNTVFVSNEGNFTYGNGTISYIDDNSDTVLNSVFLNKNGFPLGDVVQSLTLYNNKIFVVINNSAKIYVMDAETASYLGKVQGLTSPRYLIVIDSSKAYISDLYANAITIINPQTYEKTGVILTQCSTEAMTRYGDYVYVTNWNYGNKILKIDVLQDKVVDSLIVTYQPNSLQIDKNGRLWVLSDGGMNPDTSLDEYPALTCVDLLDFEIIKTIKFSDKKSSPVHLCMNDTHDTLYYINSSWAENIAKSGVYAFAVTDTSLQDTPLIAENDMQFYGLDVHNGMIYVTDAKDFVQQGDFLIYTKKGKLIKKYQVGINPSFILFYE